jgi:hypothetical protein
MCPRVCRGSHFTHADRSRPEQLIKVTEKCIPRAVQHARSQNLAIRISQVSQRIFVCPEWDDKNPPHTPRLNYVLACGRLIESNEVRTRPVPRAARTPDTPLLRIASLLPPRLRTGDTTGRPGVGAGASADSGILISPAARVLCSLRVVLQAACRPREDRHATTGRPP